jgi:pimeloyl-ACP methyl ester carboxylesterase
MAEEGIGRFRRRSVMCASPKGLHRMAYVEWGDPRNRNVLVCVHGLTRSGRDFDELARALCEQYRVVCPDVAGRGESDRLPDPMLYAMPQYVSDMVTLIARLDVEAVDWLGTSRGGLIGMALAAQAGSPVRRLVLNDAGPEVTRASLERIAVYLGHTPEFGTIEEAEAYVRKVAAPFGPHSDAQWRFLTEVWVRRGADGRYRAHYDPRIAEAFRAAMPEKDLTLWPLYEAVRCPTLALRGEHSDLLTRETHRKMALTGPKARLVEVAGVGHAPTLLTAEQIEPVRRFLLEPEGEPA